MISISKYLRNRKKAIGGFLAKSKRDFTSESFHELRIEIKKLNTFFDYIKFCNKDFRKKKMFRPFQLIYQQAGKIRKLQVEELLLNNYLSGTTLPKYKEQIRFKKSEAMNIYFILVEKRLLHKIKKRFKKVVLLLRTIPKSKQRMYPEKIRKEIELLLYKKSLPSVEFHNLRKLLKSQMYIRKYLNVNPKSDLLIANENLPELLGEWHDLQMMIRHLQIALENAAGNVQEKKQLDIVKETIITDTHRLVRKIHFAISKDKSHITTYAPVKK